VLRALAFVARDPAVVTEAIERSEG